MLIVWTFVVNGLFRFQANIDMKKIPAEEQVYTVLTEHVVEPGRYTVNPALTAENRFPEGKPVYSVLYSGMGHEAAGNLMWVGLIVFFVAPLIAAWLLSQTSERILSRYGRKVLFFSAIGVLFAIFRNLADFGIGGYPLGDTLLLAAHSIVVWTLMGLVVAWRIKPDRLV